MCTAGIHASCMHVHSMACIHTWHTIHDVKQSWLHRIDQCVPIYWESSIRRWKRGWNRSKKSAWPHIPGPTHAHVPELPCSCCYNFKVGTLFSTTSIYKLRYIISKFTHLGTIIRSADHADDEFDLHCQCMPTQVWNQWKPLTGPK